jgi:hypothetical protein
VALLTSAYDPEQISGWSDPRGKEPLSELVMLAGTSPTQLRSACPVGRAGFTSQLLEDFLRHDMRNALANLSHRG